MGVHGDYSTAYCICPKEGNKAINTCPGQIPTREITVVSSPLLIFCLFFVVGCGGNNDGAPPSNPVQTTPTLWDDIKSSASPALLLGTEFNAPTRLANVSTLAWEDGLYISDDGLHLFSFYAPVSLFKFQEYVNTYPYVAPNVCAPISDYIRGPVLNGSDFELQPPYDLPDSICNHGNGLVHSEIAHASRASVNDDFSTWSRHALSTDFVYDGGFSSTDNGDGTYHLIYSQSTSADQNDIYWVQNATSLNPTSATPVPFPAPVNTNMQEDNPHLEKISASELVLLFDNHYETGGSGDTHISYSVSIDNGTSWSVPAIITTGTINDFTEDLNGHLYRDGANNWWLYFTSNRDGKVEIWRIQHDSNNLVTDFDNWNTASMEKVIAVNGIAGDTGTMEGVGEPSLTANGDLYFVVVYCKNQSDQTAFDGCDIDPWVATKK